MKTVIVYAEVNGLATDEHGEPELAGLKLEFDIINDNLSYAEVVEALDVDYLLSSMGLAKLGIGVDDINFVSQDEYDAKYGGYEDGDGEED